MKSHRPYLVEWWTIFSAVTTALVVVYFRGMFDVVNEADMTKLGFVILLLFYLSTIHNGWLIYKLNRLTDDQIDYHIRCKAFLSGSMPVLGLIGTGIGLAYLFHGAFGGGGSVDIAKAVPVISTGTGTALYTTICGLIFGLLLRIQSFILWRYKTRRGLKCH